MLFTGLPDFLYCSYGCSQPLLVIEISLQQPEKRRKIKGNLREERPCRPFVIRLEDAYSSLASLPQKLFIY